MDTQILREIVACDIMGLLDDEDTISRWGIVARHGEEIPTTRKKSINSYDRAMKWVEEYKKTAHVGCMYREVFKDGEWSLTASEEF